MMTTDEIIALSREQQHEFYKSLDDAERRALDRQLTSDGHGFTADRMARDHFVLTSTAPNLRREREELLDDYAKTRAHKAEIDRRIAEGATEYRGK